MIFLKKKYTNWYDKNNVKPIDIFGNKVIEKIIYSQADNSFSLDGNIAPHKVLALFLINGTNQ